MATKAKAKPDKAAPPSTEAIQIDRIATERMLVPILGTAPLVVHRFGEKAKRQMLDAMQGRKSPKEPKNPEAEYQASFYRMKDGTPGFPAIGFKAATIGGARYYRGLTMTELRQYLFVHGESGPSRQQMVRIEGEPQMREDVVKVQRGADLRYRAEFEEWTTTLEVTYVVSALTRESVLSLIDAGGMGIGVGEWRPERRGDFGTYRVDPTRKIVSIS